MIRHTHLPLEKLSDEVEQVVGVTKEALNRGAASANWESSRRYLSQLFRITARALAMELYASWRDMVVGAKCTKPRCSKFRSTRQRTTSQGGMVLCIEPMINMGGRSGGL